MLKGFKTGDAVITTEYADLGQGVYYGLTSSGRFHIVKFPLAINADDRSTNWWIDPNKLFHAEVDFHTGKPKCAPAFPYSAFDDEKTEVVSDTVADDFISPADKYSLKQVQAFRVKPHGGPQAYYDMPFGSWVTTNDMMEYLAEHKWGKYGIHLKDIFKGLCRWGDKEGTTTVYDTRKVIYYGCRVLMMQVGAKVLREYLVELLDDKQFEVKDKE